MQAARSGEGLRASNSSRFSVRIAQPKSGAWEMKKNGNPERDEEIEHSWRRLFFLESHSGARREKCANEVVLGRRAL